MSITANYHTHTTYCDGENTPREMVESALKLGFTSLGFSGHMDTDVHMELKKYVDEIRSLQNEYQARINILCGVEWDNLYDISCTEGMDYVIGSTHFLDVQFERPLSIDDTPEDVVLLCNKFFNGNYYKLCREYFRLKATIIDKYPCTFIGHFDLISKFNNDLHFIDEEDQRYLTTAFDAMEYLVSKGVPFEINTRQAYRGKLFPSKTMLKHLRNLGGEIIISSDAHKAEDIDAGFEYAVNIARECGFNHANYMCLNHNKLEFVQYGLYE